MQKVVTVVMGDGGDGGKAIADDVGPGGSCLAIIIGHSCGGSTGSMYW